MKLKKTILKRNKILFLISILLIFITLTYFFTGFYDLTITQNTAIDLFSRWQEQQYIYRGTLSL